MDTVKVRDGRAFISGYRGPSVWDVTFPDFPLSLASTHLSQDSRGMNVRGDLILDGGRWPYDPYTQRFAVFDGMGSQIVPIATIAPSGTVEAVEVEEGRIYVAASKGGVDIFELGASSDPPFILGPPRPISCVAGTPAQFGVDAIGGAQLRYQWFKDGEPVLNATNRTLRLAAVNAADVAEYSVLVENEVGSTLGGTARLDLIETPRVTLVKVNLGTAWGTQVTLAAPAGLQAQVFGTGDFRAQKGTFSMSRDSAELLVLTGSNGAKGGPGVISHAGVLVCEGLFEGR